MSDRVRLLDSKVGLVPLNWKYEPTRIQSFLGRISEYGFTGIQISLSQSETIEFMKTMAEYAIEPAEIYLPIKCSVNGVTASASDEIEKILFAGGKARVQNAIFAIDGSADRDESAARSETGPGLTETAFTDLAENIERWALIAVEFGMNPSFHPHAGTYIETPSETKKLMSLLTEKVSLCLDVGHWLVGGGDPVSAILEYGNRISHIHVKDVNMEILQKMKQGTIPNMDYAVEALKLFVPAGTGALNIRELFIALEEIKYSGWLMSEQDTAWEPTEEKSAESMANIQAALRT